MRERFNLGQNMFAILSDSRQEIVVEDLCGNYSCTLKATGNVMNWMYGKNCPRPIEVGAGFILALREMSKVNDKIDSIKSENNRLKDIIKRLVDTYKEMEEVKINE